MKEDEAMIIATSIVLATKAGDRELVERLINANPDLYSEEDWPYVIQRRLNDAIEANSPDLIDYFVSHGAKVRDLPDERDPEKMIEDACLGGPCRKEAVRRLLELGAELNFEAEDGLRCRTLDFAISKGDLEMVELLIEYGAAFNNIYRGMTALDHARSRRQGAIADYLVSIGGKTAEEQGWVSPPEVAPELSQVIEGYARRTYAPEEILTIHEIVQCEPSIKIHVLKAGYQNVLLTEGMSSKPVPIAEGDEELRHVELELSLPWNWPLGQEALQDPAASWPVQWLRRLAFQPHQTGEPLGRLSFVSSGSPPAPFHPSTELCWWMIRYPKFWQPLYVSSEKQIAVYEVCPLFAEEYQLAQEQGVEALLERFSQNYISHINWFHRKNAAL